MGGDDGEVVVVVVVVVAAAVTVVCGSLRVSVWFYCNERRITIAAVAIYQRAILRIPVSYVDTEQM